MNALIRTIEIMGIIAFALTGIYEARKKGMDIIGVYASGLILAYTGSWILVFQVAAALNVVGAVFFVIFARTDKLFD